MESRVVAGLQAAQAKLAKARDAGDIATEVEAQKEIAKLGVEESRVASLKQKQAEIKEKDSNQILDFTRELKNIDEDDKKIIIESLWNIIYSDKNADMYETNLMRRLSGLLYLDTKVVGDIKEKIKNKKL